MKKPLVSVLGSLTSSASARPWYWPFTSVRALLYSAFDARCLSWVWAIAWVCRRALVSLGARPSMLCSGCPCFIWEASSQVPNPLVQDPSTPKPRRIGPPTVPPNTPEKEKKEATCSWSQAPTPFAAAPQLASLRAKILEPDLKLQQLSKSRGLCLSLVRVV